MNDYDDYYLDCHFYSPRHVYTEEEFTYTRPFLAALRESIGVDFHLDLDEHDWGEVQLKSGHLEGDVYLIIGSVAEGGPSSWENQEPRTLYTDAQVDEQHEANGTSPGHAIGVYRSNSGDCRAVLVDHLANTPDVVAQLATIALAAAAANPETDLYPRSTRQADGTIVMVWCDQAGHPIGDPIPITGSVT